MEVTEAQTINNRTLKNTSITKIGIISSVDKIVALSGLRLFIHTSAGARRELLIRQQWKRREKIPMGPTNDGEGNIKEKFWD